MPIPFNYKPTDDEELNKTKTEIAASFAQVPDALGASVLATDASVTVDKETAIVIIDTTPNDVTITLPATNEDRQTVIMNRSNYAAKIKSADAKQVFPDLSAGGTATVVCVDSAWFSSTGKAK